MKIQPPVNMLPPGTRVKVRPCSGGYPLPAGLPEGAEVTLDVFDHGFYPATTDDGRVFQIFCACIDAQISRPTFTSSPPSPQPARP